MVSSLGIVLPAYNEEARLGPALDELFGYLCSARDRLPATVNVLVVDDGSTDGTAELVRRRPEYSDGETAPGKATAKAKPNSCPELRLLTIPHAGKGSAVRAGMLAGDGDLLIFADADMATPADQIPLLVKALELADVALGSRIQPDGSDMRKSQPRGPALDRPVVPLRRPGLGDGPRSATPSAASRASAASAARDLFGLLGSPASSSTWTSST